jgi:hypothetical protein
MADTAYDADHLRHCSQVGARRHPQQPRHVRSSICSTSISMPSAIWSNAASQSSRSSAASQPASKRPPEIIIVLSSLSQP